MIAHRILACAVLAFLLAVSQAMPARAAEPALAIELNKLEAGDDGCRAYVLFENETGHVFDALTLDLIAFDAEGIVAKRLAVNAAPLAADKTLVKVFDIADVHCDSIGRLLLNGLIDCGYSDGAPDDCLAFVSTRSRATVDFIR